MKKAFFVFAFLLCVSLGFSQNNIENKISFGLNVGGNYSSIRGSEFAERNKADFGYLIGLSFEYKFNNKFSLYTNVNYENINVSYEQPKQNVIIGCLIGTTCSQPTDRVLTKFQNISLPLLLKYNFNESTTGFFVNSGIFFSYLIDTTNYIEKNENDVDFNDLFMKLDAGFSIGFGYQLRISTKSSLTIEFRNSLGLINISDVNISSFDSVKSNSINLIANYQFNL